MIRVHHPLGTLDVTHDDARAAELTAPGRTEDELADAVDNIVATRMCAPSSVDAILSRDRYLEWLEFHDEETEAEIISRLMRQAARLIDDISTLDIGLVFQKLRPS